MNYELLGFAVSILGAMWAGFVWLSNQIKDVRNELKTDINRVEESLKADIKRVEDKLDNKEKDLRATIDCNKEKATNEVVAQKMELNRLAIQTEEREKTARSLEERLTRLIAALKREMPQLDI